MSTTRLALNKHTTFIALAVAFGILLFVTAGLRNALLYANGLGIGILFATGSIGFTRVKKQ